MKEPLQYEDFKGSFLRKPKEIELEVGDLINIPYKKQGSDPEEPYTKILFFVINKETIGSVSYIDIMSKNTYLVEYMTYLREFDLGDQRKLSTTPYRNSNIYYRLNQLVKCFPKEIQDAMIEKQIVRISPDKYNRDRNQVEQIGKIWALDTDEVFDHRTTHLDFTRRPYVLNQFPFFKMHPDYFDYVNARIILRNQIFPDKVSFLENGFLFVTDSLNMHFVTPICMRLVINT